MLHCLALPLVLTIFPILNIALLDEPTFHLIMIVFILPISLVALTIGCRQHKDPLTMILGGVGLVVLSFTAFFGHDLFGLTGERIVTSIGGLILAVAHIQNYRCCRRDDCNHDY
ncbi:MAG: MerC domain-containing protein [Gammaproteobacteria bacterium]|nr:MerC domain-containing protein [Gammaproteobacteria bacterium]